MCRAVSSTAAKPAEIGVRYERAQRRGYSNPFSILIPCERTSMRRLCIHSILAALFTLMTGSNQAADRNNWSRLRHPLPAQPEVLGGYNAGCIRGAVDLPRVGRGYQVMRVSRHRYFGHPRLVDFVERFGRAVERQGLDPVLVGDLAQPRGGPMPFGHASHQSGLDVDIWFRTAPRQRHVSTSEIEELPMRSVIRVAEGRLDPEFWSERERRLLELAAQDPEVERIFVNPVIKLGLCQSEGKAAWLEKIRPWWGHDAHFHVRLACPPDSPRCDPQKPPPAGNGCDGDLEDWVNQIIALATEPPKPRPTQRPAAPSLPVACGQILAAPDRPSSLAKAK